MRKKPTLAAVRFGKRKTVQIFSFNTKKAAMEFIKELKTWDKNIQWSTTTGSIG